MLSGWSPQLKIGESRIPVKSWGLQMTEQSHYRYLFAGEVIAPGDQVFDKVQDDWVDACNIGAVLLPQFVGRFRRRVESKEQERVRVKLTPEQRKQILVSLEKVIQGYYMPSESDKVFAEFVMFLIGCALLLLCALTPVSCTVLSKSGPEVFHTEFVFRDVDGRMKEYEGEPFGLILSAGLLMTLFGVGGYKLVKASLSDDDEKKDKSLVKDHRDTKI